MKKCFFIFAALLFLFTTYAQKSKKDSLVAKLSEAKTDSVKVKLLNELGTLLFSSQDAEAKNYSEQAMNLARKSNNKKAEAHACRILGTIAYYNNEYLKAKDFYLAALDAGLAAKDTPAIASAYRNVSLACSKLAQEKLSVEYSLKALDLFLRKKDSTKIANVYNDLGNAFYSQHDFTNAIEYYRKAYRIAFNKGNDELTAVELNNIGSVYCEQGSLDSGYTYFNRSFVLRKKISDYNGLLTCYGNFADIHIKRKEYDKALENDLEALKIAKQFDADELVSRVMNNLATDYMWLKNYPKALECASASLKLAQSSNYIEGLKNSYLSLYDISRKAGKMGEALENYQNYIKYRDSLSGGEVLKKITQSEMRFIYEKDKEKLQLEQEKKDAINKEIIEKQTILRNSFIVGFLLLLILVFFVYRGYRIKQKSNIEVSKQKHLIEEKQKEIIDSINYAKRIQQSLMPSEKYIDKNLSKLKRN